MTKEIVSVQVGTYANYVGAHFWNLQDEYLATPIQLRELSPAALFREIGPSSSLYRSGLRYAPRLQVVDSTGAFGALSTQAGVVLADAISERELSAPGWGGLRQTYIRERIQPSAYIHHLQNEEREDKDEQLEKDGNISEEDKHSEMFSNIRYWSDFLKVRLHPRSCTALGGVHHGVTNLDYFDTGQELASSPVEDWYDELRFFIEECDSFGGLSILTNADDAFAGITSKYITHTVEELGTSSPLMTFGVHNSKRFTTKASAEAFNAAFDSPVEGLWSQNEARLAALCQEYSVEYVPLSSQVAQRMPMLRVQNGLFHSSAALGLSLDVALTPLRLADSLSGLLSFLRPAPFANFGSLICNIPKSPKDLNYGTNTIETKGTVNLSDAWKPTLNKNSSELVHLQRCVEVVSSRGLPDDLPIHSGIDLPVTLPIPFPSVFNPALLGRNQGKVVSKAPEGVQVEQVCVVAGMATVPQFGRRALQALSDSLKTVNYAQQRNGHADLEEAREALQSRSEDYDSL
ncbi:Tubulin [Gracilaria domingensis]|nr:Tubulin [Gracilaria domingensis]